MTMTIDPARPFAAAAFFLIFISLVSSHGCRSQSMQNPSSAPVTFIKLTTGLDPVHQDQKPLYEFTEHYPNLEGSQSSRMYPDGAYYELAEQEELSWRRISSVAPEGLSKIKERIKELCYSGQFAQKVPERDGFQEWKFSLEGMECHHFLAPNDRSEAALSHPEIRKWTAEFILPNR